MTLKRSPTLLYRCFLLTLFLGGPSFHAAAAPIAPTHPARPKTAPSSQLPSESGISTSHEETIGVSANPPAELTSDEPPPSTYDLAHEQARGRMHPETTQLMGQLIRTVIALAAVLALIFVLAKVLMPKLGNRFAAGDASLLTIKSRLRLDETHQVLLLEIRGRQEVVLALGPTGAHLICPVTPQGDKPPTIFAADADRLLGSP